MRLLCLFAIVATMAGSVAARAEERRYEAIVDADDGEYVLSGPGPKYYPTARLNRGDRVIVRRHDPGGWCMIEPPAGSFSWILASHVDRDGNSRGTVKSNRVVVHTGSALDINDFTTVQADLSKGDAVEILDEREFSFDGERRSMLKISPVKFEWRWIARKSIVAADAFRAEPFPRNHSAPSKRGGPVADSDSDSFAKPVSTGPISIEDDRDPSFEKSGPRKAISDPDQPNSKQRLSAIDRQFRDMIQQEPTAWDLDSIENQYQDLDGSAGQASMTKTIATRLDAVKRYRKIHKDYMEFFTLAAETKQRDAQLLSQQGPFQSQLGGQDQRVVAANTDLQPMPQPVASPPNPSSSASNPAPAASASFDGAGIVQKMAKTFPGGPQYVLVSPEGKMLAFLQPTAGVDLNRYNGRSMGIIGQRARRDDWNADVINVRGLQPVQLRGSR